MLAHSEEIRDIDSLNREELIAQLLEFRDCARTKFTWQWLDRQSTERLQMFLLAAQLYRALLYQASREDHRR
jgi:hypothetical protein